MRWFQIVINAMEKIKWYKNWLETKKETLDMELTIKWYCCSLAKSHPTLCDPMDCSMPGFPVLHYLLEFAQIHLHWVNYAMSSSATPCHFAFSLSQHQSLFQWVSSYQVAKVLELQLHHQSLQWIFRVDFLWDWLVWSPCCPRDSQESSPTPQFKSINDRKELSST